MPESIPFRWPASWTDASNLELLKGSPITCIAGEKPPPFPLGGIEFIALDPTRQPAGIALREGVWPRVLVATRKDAAGGGATGGPWVDSNAWTVRLAQITEPSQVVWLTYSTPGGNEITPIDSFVKPIAEAEAYGAHWVIAPDDYFAGLLAQRAEKALGEWKRMMAALRFFEARHDRRTWTPEAPLTVASTFQGDDKLLSEEFLNLAPRRRLAYNPMRAQDVPGAAFTGAKAVLYLETAPPPGATRARLLEFARAGGLLIAPRGTVDAPAERRLAEHSVRGYGKGRVAMPLQKWEDPFTLVDQVHVLVSHREDPVRVWNGGDLDVFHLTSPRRDRALTHLVPYASGRTLSITLGYSSPYRRARVLTPASETAAPLVRAEMGLEVQLSPFVDYAAVELET